MNLLKWITISTKEKEQFYYLHKLIPFLVFEGVLFFVLIALLEFTSLALPLIFFIITILTFLGYAYFLCEFWYFFKNDDTKSG